MAVMPTNPRNFNIDNVRVVKIMGGSLASSRVVQGMVFGREPESEILSSSHLWGWVYVQQLNPFRFGKKAFKGQGCGVYLRPRHSTDGNKRHCTPQKR